MQIIKFFETENKQHWLNELEKCKWRSEQILYNFLIENKFKQEVKMNKKKQRKKSRGFTLIELMIVLAIIGILLTLIAPKVTGYMETAEKIKRDNDFNAVHDAILNSFIDYSSRNDILLQPKDVTNTDYFDYDKSFWSWNSYNETDAVPADPEDDFNGGGFSDLGYLIHLGDYLPEGIKINIQNKSSTFLYKYSHLNRSTTYHERYFAKSVFVEPSDTYDPNTTLTFESNGKTYYVSSYNTGTVGVGNWDYLITDHDPNTFSIELIFKKGTKELETITVYNDNYLSINNSTPVFLEDRIFN